MRRVLPFWGFLVALLLTVALAPGVRADDEDEPAPEPVEEVDAEEARRLAKELERAAKRRKAEDVLPVLEEVDDRSHPSFHKPLLKMLTHVQESVALAACDALAAQNFDVERVREKFLGAVWKSGWNHRTNKKRFVVRCNAVRVMGEVSGAPLEDREARDVLKLWRQIVGNPDERHAPALVALCSYIETTGDKRFCRLLAEEIDEPGATAVNSPSNPPAEWWERRWKMWKQVKAYCVETLEELTDQSFKDTASAREWFEANEEEFGFDW